MRSECEVLAQRGVTCLSRLTLPSLPIILISPPSCPFSEIRCNGKISRQPRIRERFIVFTAPQVGWQIKRWLFFCHLIWKGGRDPPQKSTLSMHRVLTDSASHAGKTWLAEKKPKRAFIFVCLKGEKGHGERMWTWERECWGWKSWLYQLRQ